MPAAVEITQYCPADESEIVALVRQLQDYEATLFDRIFLVARLEGRILGYATLRARQTTKAVIDEVIYSYATIGDLVVAGSARGLGIGTRLVEECETLARAAGQKWLRVSVLAANGHARRLYERMGFADLFLEMEKPLA